MRMEGYGVCVGVSTGGWMWHECREEGSASGGVWVERGATEAYERREVVLGKWRPQSLSASL